MDSIKKKLENLENYIAQAANKTNRAVKDIRVICVTKYAQIDDIISAVKSGCYEIGENRQQELSKKYDILKKSLTGDEFEKIKWHFIGHLQTNKIKSVIRLVSMIQSVDSLHLASAIEREAEKIDKKIDVLLQVKISPEETKFGFGINEVDQVFKQIVQYQYLRIKGLMGIAVNCENPENTRIEFRNLKVVFDRANKLLVSLKFPKMEILSMGMSNDFMVAIEEGANMIRVGSIIFGG